MAGYIGNKSSVTLVDGYNEAEADAEFVTKTGDSMTGNLSLGDNNKAIFGAGSDLQIYHDGSHSYIAEGGSATGSLRIRGENLLLEDNSGKDYLNAVADAQVELSHNGSKKFETTSDGVNVQGAITSQSPNSGVLLEEYAADAFGANFTMRKSRNATIGGQTAVASGDTLGNITFQGSDGDEFVSGASIQSFVDGTPGNNDMPGNLVFKTTPDGSSTLTERLRITSAGNVGVGTSSPSADFVVSNGGAAGIELQPEIATDTNRITNYDRAASAYMNFRLDALTHSFLTSNTERMSITSAGAKNFGAHQSESGGFNIFAGAGSTASFAARFEGTGTGASNVVQITNGYGEVGSIKIASNGTTTNYNTGSDYRLKTDVQPVTDASARIQSLNPVNFEWIRSGTRTDGFLAHEAQAVVPDCVSGDKDAMKDEGYEVTPATGDIYTPATEAYVDDDGNNVDAVDEVIHSADAEQPETLEDGQQWRETTAAVMGTRSVPDYQGIDQSKLVPLLTAALQEALTEIASLKTRVEALET